MNDQERLSAKMGKFRQSLTLALKRLVADRKLAGRARHRGARVVSPREFLKRCTGCPPGGERSC